MSRQPMAGVLLTGPSFGTPVDTDLSGGFRSPQAHRAAELKEIHTRIGLPPYDDAALIRTIRGGDSQRCHSGRFPVHGRLS